MRINLASFARHLLGGPIKALVKFVARPDVQAVAMESLAAAQKPEGLTDPEREDMAVKYARIFWPGLVDTPAEETLFRGALQAACGLRKGRLDFLQRVPF
jgi:hypothetical protein